DDASPRAFALGHLRGVRDFRRARLLHRRARRHRDNKSDEDGRNENTEPQRVHVRSFSFASQKSTSSPSMVLFVTGTSTKLARMSRVFRSFGSSSGGPAIGWMRICAVPLQCHTPAVFAHFTESQS